MLKICCRINYVLKRCFSSRPQITHADYSHVEPYLFSWETLLCWLHREPTPVPLRVRCPACNTPGLFVFAGDPSNGPGLTVPYL